MARARKLQTVEDTPVLRKERGAFFTPPAISAFLVDWAVRGAGDRVLEPSCGEASFLLPAAERLTALGATTATGGEQLRGIEVHRPSASAARRLLKDKGHAAKITAADFFDVEPDATHDVVVGNPPYIRYQNFSGDLRHKALAAAAAQGVRLTRLASSWAAFVVHASRFLKPDGRMGLVLPAELLTVNYAAPVRRFLLRHFAKVRLVLFEELVFPGVLEEVVLLLAEGHGGAECFEVYQARDARDLARIDRAGWTGFTPEHGGKWTPALLSASLFSRYTALQTGGAFDRLIDWGETYLGAVTGNNGFFTLSAEEARELGLKERELLRISPPGSRHLRDLSFPAEAWQGLTDAGRATSLFYPPGRPSKAAQRYIESGERLGVHRAYKCRVRKPWWRVPVVEVPDLFLTYMDQDRPRLVSNGAGAAHLNSLYGVQLNKGLRRLGRELLPLACLNTVTLLGAEMVGRSYGGGLLKLEPKEADLLPVPSAATLKDARDELRDARAAAVEALSAGDLMAAVDVIDSVLLRGRLGVSKAELADLREAREVLLSRRVARGKSGRGKS